MKMAITVENLGKLNRAAREILEHIEAINKLRAEIDAWGAPIRTEIILVDKEEGQ